MPEEMSEDLEKVFYKIYGYSPNIITDMKIVFEDLHNTIHYYLERSQIVGEMERKQIRKLSFECDEILVTVNELRFLSDQLVEDSRKKFFLKKEVKPDKKKLEEVKKLIEKMKKDIPELASELKKHISAAEKHA